MATNAMIEYENGYGQLQYDYDKRVELPMKVIIFQKSMYAAQIFMAMGAITCATGAIIVQRNDIRFTSLPFGRIDNELIWIPFACAAVSLIASFVGCIGAKRPSKNALVAYLLLISVALGLGIATAAEAWADSSSVHMYAQNQWGSMTITQIDTFQQTFLCCNFDTVMPCCRRDDVGNCVNEYMCYDKVHTHLLENFYIIAATSTLQSIYLFAVALLALLLCKFIEYNPDMNRDKELENVGLDELYHKGINYPGDENISTKG